MKPTDHCIFCGKKAKLTSEHIFGRWLKKHVKAESPNTIHITSITRPNPKTGETVRSMAKGELNRPGAPHSHQLKLVCGPCNNGWMGKIQEQAQPLLLPLLAGTWQPFDADQLAIISAWATMVTMCIEFADLNTVATSSEERRAFMDRREPGPTWQVYFGLVQLGIDPGTFWHRAAYIFKDAPPSRVPEKQNAQTTTVLLGGSFFHALSAPTEFLPEPAAYAKNLGIKRFLPLPNQPPSAPFIFTHAGVLRVGGFFWTNLGVSGIPHEGMWIDS